LPLVHYLIELRLALLKSALAIIVLFLLLFPFADQIYTFIAAPIVKAIPGSNLIAIGVISPFLTPLKMSLILAVYIAMPYLLYQLWKFVAPALYRNEKIIILPLVLSSTTLFYSGLLFSFYVVFPVGFKMLITFGGSEFTAMPRMSEYVSFFGKLMLGFGIAFEMPVVTYFLAKLGLVTDRTLKDFARYAIVIIFILAAVLTPPDLFSQLAMAAPLLILYGISILIAKIVNPEKEENQ
jgi:sec-independent protein translocase protein TatC